MTICIYIIPSNFQLLKWQLMNTLMKETKDIHLNLKALLEF